MISDKESIFKEWVHLYSDLLYAYALRNGFHEENAQDLLQETFIAAWRNMGRFKGDASVRNWLFVILKSKIVDHFRKPANKIVVEIIHKEYKDHTFFDEKDHWRKGNYPGSWSVDFSNTLEIKEFQSIFKNCSSKLKQIQNAVFVMKYVEGKESEEICKALGISASNYWVLMHRAKVQLRSCLQKNWTTK